MYMIDASSLQGTVTSTCSTARGLVIVIHLRNDSDRALHYVADVRAIKYDPVTRRLEVRLSDEGRTVIPGAVNIRPRFHYIDPGAEAELTLVLPNEIVMLAPPPDPERRTVAFQKHRIADAEELEIYIAWADTPYYEDTRDTEETRDAANRRYPVARWQQHEARIVHRRR
jgi:hypothetical protein